jgi:hypothetical protein
VEEEEEEGGERKGVDLGKCINANKALEATALTSCFFFQTFNSLCSIYNELK